jgi:hypothetical protein
MSYSNPDNRDYTFGAVSFAANTTRKIRGPKGKKGYLRGTHVFVTTAFVGTTTPANLQVGVSGTAAAYETITFGTAGTPTPVSTALSPEDGVFTTYTITSRELPADTDILLTCNAGVGTPAGVADITLHIEWMD